MEDCACHDLRDDAAYVHRLVSSSHYVCVQASLINVCECRKAIGSAKGQQAEKWLQRILESLPKAYEQSHFSGYLYLASHIVRAVGTEGSPHRPMVASAVTPMIQEACSRLATLGACNRRPHDTDDLFLMAYKGLAHAPSLFLGQAVLSNLLRVAAVGMLVQHQHAFQSIQSFMYRLLDVQTLSMAPERDQTQAMLKVCCLVPAKILLVFTATLAARAAL